jgi:hypothetical protein
MGDVFPLVCLSTSHCVMSVLLIKHHEKTVPPISLVLSLCKVVNKDLAVFEWHFPWLITKEKQSKVESTVLTGSSHLGS